MFPSVHPVSVSGRSVALGLSALVLALAACAAPARPPTDLPESPSPVASLPTPTAEASLTPANSPTETVAPTATSTRVPSPTESPAARTISPDTLAQLRPLWVLDEPGNPNAQGGCQDMACWMLTRIGSYAFSPDGKILAAGVCTVDSTENTTNPRHYRFNCDGPAEVRLYDAVTGALRQTLAVGDFPISLAFHPGRPLLAVGMAHRSIEIWDLESGQKIQTLLHSTKRDGVVGLKFSPDGASLASYGDRLLQFWLWERGLPAGLIENVADFAFSPSGGTLATLFWSERRDYAEARFYPLDDLERFRAFRLDWAKSPSRVVYVPDGSALIAVGAFDLELVDPQSGDILREVGEQDLLRPSGLSGNISNIPEITRDGRVLVMASVTEGEADFREGIGLLDPASAGAQVWLLDFDELTFEMGEAFFYSFSQMRLGLAPGDSYLTARDPYTGTLWIWGVDPTVTGKSLTCLGTCSS